MQYRQLGRTDMKVSAVSFGAWAIGGAWGPVDDEDSMKALHAAIDAGTNFVDTADATATGTANGSSRGCDASARTRRSSSRRRQGAGCRRRPRTATAARTSTTGWTAA